MPENLVLIDASSEAGLIRGLRSGVAKALLKAGQWARIQNLRWFTGRPVVRGGTQLLLTAPCSGATIVDWWTGELNGTTYIVGAFLVGTKYEVWYSTGTSWTRLSEVGGWFGGTTGDSRQTSLTGRFTFCACKSPTGFAGGATTPARDILLISNGQDYIRVWDPDRSGGTTLTVSGATNASPIRVTTGTHNLNDGDTIVISGVLGNTAANGSFWVDKQSGTTFDLYYDEALTLPVVGNGAYVSGGTAVQKTWYAIHRPVIVPADASVFTQKAMFDRKWQVASASGKTFYSAGVVNDTAGTDIFSFGNTVGGVAYGVYTGANTVILWGWGVDAAAADIATVYFAGSSLALGKGLVIFTEDITQDFGADTMFSHVKIEVNNENTTYDLTTAGNWKTVYDPFSSNDYERRVLSGTLVNNLDPALYSDPPRKMWFFPTDHLATADKLIYHIRVTRSTNAPAPSSTASVAILAICGAGSIPGGSEFTLSYEDEPGRSESYGLVAPDNSDGVSLAEIGGPFVMESVQPVFKVPVIDGAFYDYQLAVKNSAATSPITGGLDGEPSRFNVYLRAPGEGVATYFYSIKIWDNGSSGGSNVWSKLVSTVTIPHNTSDVTDTYAIDWKYRDYDRTAPSAFQISIPPAYAMAFAGNRLIVGNIYDPVGTVRQTGDLYFSEYGKFNRMQAIVTSEESGGRNRYAGEVIQFIGATSSGAQAASDTLVWTNRECKILGGSGALAGKGISSVDLSSAFTLSKKGTNSFRSVIENDGAWFWADQYGQFQRHKNGRTVNLSRLAVDDTLANVPSAMRSKVKGAFYNDAAVWSYAEAEGTANTRIIGFNDVVEEWEFDDDPPVSADQILVWFDSSANGSGQKLLICASTGKTYWYDKPGALDLDDPVAVRLTSREFTHEGGKSLRIGGVYMSVTAQDQELTFDRYYRDQTGLSRSTVNASSGRFWDGGRTEVVSGFDDGRGERGLGAYLDVQGLLGAGSVIDHLGIELVEESSDDAPDASV